MAHTVTGAPQTAYLETTSPTLVPVDLQFFATRGQATAEAVTAQRKLKGFHATVIGNAIAFSRGDGRTTVPTATITALRAALP